MKRFSLSLISGCLLSATSPIGLAQTLDSLIFTNQTGGMTIRPARVERWTPQPDDRTELHRTIVKSYTVTAKDALSVDNHFGDVTVTLWERNEMRVEVAVTSSSDKPERARKVLDAVTIDEQRKDDTFSFKTIIADGFDGGWKKGDRQNYLRVDYRISMPKANRLAIKNSFGNTTIPNFWAPLSLSSKFGNVYGADFNNPNTRIQAEFGNVSIRDIQNGTLTMSFGDIDINSGNVLSIVQDYGKLKIGETNQVDARMSYADASIGLIRQSAKLRLNYARRFLLGQVGASANKIDVEANYSTVAMPVQNESNGNFDITVTHGGFSYPNLPSFRLTTPPSPPSLPRRPSQTRQYIGQFGTGGGPHIRVVATYGDVRFK
ncbi:DUF4097 family beta strand repeat protein [Fibrella sp. HMF5335]|uniref:DUF4097 family beta strand repeat protein n=1 Tax=Fibrella rubiginis TaxID=2817060 RepID=A0A939K3J6_9BACT|nr:DUF4097 family beta strand repeat-containing protein [Fibrella rubiginis]MBO0935201.1 DUF4097 family beta strand repeat protein [Fibrella rubiginis]